MKFRFAFLLLLTQVLQAQKLKKADKIILSDLQSSVSYLADDKLEGRRTGTAGEKLAYTYISDRFKTEGLIPKGDDNTYLQQFEINEGKQISKSTFFIVNGNDLKIDQDFFPLIFSANSSLEATPTISFQEKSMPWFLDLKDLLDKNKNNPHFDLISQIQQKASEIASKGGTALIITNSSSINDGLSFEGKQKLTTSAIPVIYLTKPAREKFFKDENSPLDLKIKINIEDKKRTGHNVVGYIDEGAQNTIILGAHFDHLGYGEDHNSLWTGGLAIHHGADDNASGTAALIELGKMIKNSHLKGNNYLLIAFSGEELGLFGSKYFTEHPTIDLSKVNYMINMDMIGRLNDSSHALSIGGYGTSDTWGSLFKTKEKYFNIKFDSSGIGPSDHTSFYLKNIPVLFFFTGSHKDYHKPTDVVDKINFTGELQVIKYIYHLFELTEKSSKLAFTKTREPQMGSARFTVSLGIMPDYTFSGTGVRADGIISNKIAEKVGMKAGDVITQLGDFKFSDVNSYMQVLGKFKKGDATKVKVTRGKEELIFDIIF